MALTFGQSLAKASPTFLLTTGMEHEIRDADFVLVACSEAYLRRVERREDPRKGQGVVWEINSIYNCLYLDKLVSEKFIPVLLGGSLPDDIPIPLRGFTHYRVGAEPGYDGLYRRLTDQPLVSKPALPMRVEYSSMGVAPW